MKTQHIIIAVIVLAVGYWVYTKVKSGQFKLP